MHIGTIKQDGRFTRQTSTNYLQVDLAGKQYYPANTYRDDKTGQSFYLPDQHKLPAG